MGVSDGSFKLGFGTSAFSCGSTHHKMMGVNLVPGDKRYHTPYRAEMSGAAGILTSLKIFCKRHHITNGCVTIGLDGQSVLDRITGSEQDSCKIPDFDLVKCIRTLSKELPIQIKWKWVEGHQDDHKSWNELDEWARLNVRMDSLAKAYWQFCAELAIQPYSGRIYGEHVSVRWNKRKLPYYNLYHLHDEYHGDVTGDFWIDAGQLKQSTVHSVN